MTMTTTIPFFKYQGSLQDHWRKSAINNGSEYKFNEYGFRETNHDFDKPITYICGCSITFGVGLNYEDTWAFKLGRNHINLSQGGASNAYITRTLIQACESHEPELVIAHFTFLNRTDYFFEKEKYSFASVGDWVIKNNQASKRFKDKVYEITKWAHSFFSIYRNIDGMCSFITQALLLQSYCDSKNIPLIMMAVDKLYMNNELRNLYSLLRIENFSIKTVRCDEANDGIHAGTVSNSRLAEKILEVINE